MPSSDNREKGQRDSACERGNLEIWLGFGHWWDKWIWTSTCQLGIMIAFGTCLPRVAEMERNPVKVLPAYCLHSDCNRVKQFSKLTKWRNYTMWLLSNNFASCIRFVFHIVVSVFLGWSWECLCQWGQFASLALPGALMIFFDWATGECSVFLSGKKNSLVT